MSVSIDYAADAFIGLFWGPLEDGPGRFVEFYVPWPFGRWPGRGLRVEWGVA